jgi:hypothetical protein
MNTLKYIFVSFLLSVSADAWGQTNEPKSYPWSFGISAGDVLHELFNGDDSPKAYPAFMFEYAGEQYSLQAGFRPDYNMADVQHEGFLDTEVTEQLSLSGTVAGTTHILNDRNWLIKAGVQFSGGWSREDITKDSGFDRVITRRLQWNAGVGPVIDFRFFVHPRISLGTEASLIYSWSRSELQEIFTNFPEFNNTEDVVEGSSLEVIEPATIYLRFHF